jgi:hypothetical protein
VCGVMVMGRRLCIGCVVYVCDDAMLCGMMMVCAGGFFALHSWLVMIT